MAKKAEVLLLKPLPPKGNAGDVIEVKIHFAQHVLVPQGIAVFNTKQVQNQRTAQMKKIAKNKSDIFASVKHMVTELEATGITFKKATTETGGLYDSVNTKSLTMYVEETYGTKIAHDHFELSEKIEALGEYTATFTYETIVTKFQVYVIAE